MTITSDQSPAGARGKILKFPPATPPVLRARWSAAAKYGLASTAVVLLVIGGISGLLAIGSRSPIKYVSVPVGRGAITRTVTAAGTVNPEQTVMVGSQVPGVIQSLACDYNTEVKAGQVCAKIDPHPYQATLDQYLGQLQRDRAILDKDRANLEHHRKIQVGISVARRQAEDLAHAVEQDEGTLKLDQALVDAARLNVGYTDIVSPVDGIVIARNVAQGQTIAAGLQNPTLFLIAADPKRMQVDTNTSERDIGEVRAGNRATFTVDAFPKRSFEGRVSQVRQSPQTAANGVAYDAVVSVDNVSGDNVNGDNRDLALKPGMTASTQIVVEQRTDVLRVPNQALRYVPSSLSGSEGQSAETQTAGALASGRSRIFLLRDGKPLAVNVKVGLADGNFTEIIRGEIREGDDVITAESRPDAALQVVSTPRP
jgi:HlyD family secretion protein